MQDLSSTGSPPFLQPPPAHTIGKTVVLGFLVACIVLALFMMLERSAFVVHGNSMSPTIESGQIIVVNRLAYINHSPRRGDVAVIQLPGTQSQWVIKRVIALPGETVEFRDSAVYINGALLEEPYVLASCDASRCANGIWQLAPEQYFVLGDNRNESADSRVFGSVTRSMIVGTPLGDFSTPAGLK